MTDHNERTPKGFPKQTSFPKRKPKQAPAQAAPETPAPQAQGMRLNKALAAAGVCSRRRADELIQQGVVKINGKTVDVLGTKIDPDKDVLEVRGKAVTILQKEGGHEYVLLHKPTHVVTTAKDPEGRQTVVDLLPEELRNKRVYPVGRLDFFSEGLLLLTTDGDLAHRLTHPKWHLPKRYHVLVRGEVSPEKLETMRAGMRLAEGEELAPIKVRVLTQKQVTPVLLEMTLIQGINRQIRRMCRDMELTILRLQRVSQGPLEMDKTPSGSWRRLTSAEVNALKKAVDLSE